MSPITTTTSYTKIANTNCRVNQQVKNLKKNKTIPEGIFKKCSFMNLHSIFAYC